MTTPNKQAILERATQLFMKEQSLHPGLGETTPELTELKEGGFYESAKLQLMSNMQF